ncbi:MAG: DUF4238 domain-containing protein [Candidatus Poribacteria bacterium]|nr:DUF4238 domain-containing protein [Candidatus Poribacteria bacterium]
MQYKSKNHHYVSQFYLRYFACNNEETYVNAMTKKGRIIDNPNVISNISSEKNYNSPLQEVEQSKLESEYAAILKEFLNTPNPDNLHLSNDVIEFVCFMYANNIDTRKRISDTLGEMEGQIEGFPVDHITQLDSSGHRARFDLSTALADAVFEEISSWKFVCNQTNGYKVFITGDTPVSIVNPENIQIPVEVNITWTNPRITDIGNKSIPISDKIMRREMKGSITLDNVSFQQDVMMVFPITPNFCLMGFSDSGRHKRYKERSEQTNNNVISFINLITLGCSNKVVYSHSKKMLKIARKDLSSFLTYSKTYKRNPSFDIVLLQ